MSLRIYCKNVKNREIDKSKELLKLWVSIPIDRKV